MKKKKIILSAVTVFLFIYLLNTFNSCQTSENNISEGTNSGDTGVFVGDKVCGSCHGKELADWKMSDHFHSMLLADDSSVLGDFNNITFASYGITSRFSRRGSRFILNTEGNDGKYHDYIVKYTFGHYPLQQYLVEFPGGRMQVARQTWDSKSKKWIHQYPHQKIATHDWLHWTNRGQNWNANCASCHSTDLQTNYIAAEDSFRTTWSVVNVSCESCHGAGRKHVEYVSSGGFKNGKKTNGSFLSFHSGQSSLEQLNTCAPCHSRRFSIDDAVAVTGDLLDHYIPESPHQPAYHADGQVLEEDYEYSSFLQSKMFQHNVKCSNCHNPHSGKLIMDGNKLCMSCHAKSLDSPSHTMHALNSEGSLCVNCHAPGKYFMGNDFRRDHSFRVPRPDLTVKFGTPNACNNCHTDKNAKWAAEKIIRQFGKDRPYHFSEDLIPASMGLFSSAPYLQKLCSPDTNVPQVIRATAMYYASFSSNPGSVTILLKGLKDSSSLVRYESLQSLKLYPAELWKSEAGNLLHDPVKAVRVGAADLFLSYSDSLSEGNKKIFFVSKKRIV